MFYSSLKKSIACQSSGFGTRANLMGLYLGRNAQRIPEAKPIVGSLDLHNHRNCCNMRHRIRTLWRPTRAGETFQEVRRGALPFTWTHGWCGVGYNMKYLARSVASHFFWAEPFGNQDRVVPLQGNLCSSHKLISSFQKYPRQQNIAKEQTNKPTNQPPYAAPFKHH